MIEQPTRIPEFATKGITYLKPKSAETENPAKYRPIACLPTIYKIITSCMATKITRYCEENNIMAEQQKGCKKYSLGCKEQLIIDQIVTQQANKKKHNLYMAYIDSITRRPTILCPTRGS